MSDWDFKDGQANDDYQENWDKDKYHFDRHGNAWAYGPMGWRVLGDYDNLYKV